LLAVFIVLFAVSQVDAQKAQDVSERFTENMMTESYAEAKLRSQESSQEEGQESAGTEKDKMEELKSELDSKLQSQNMTSSVTTHIDKRGLVISLNNAIFFEPGSADIKQEYAGILQGIADIVNVMDNYIRIEGHTDNIPMSSPIYPSNWELSTARAVSVVRLFLNEPNASPDKFLAVGYGEYRPVADNSTAEGRAKNRRIDIIVLSEQYNDLEKQIID
jgi:chemotaxis protein MotB